MTGRFLIRTIGLALLALALGVVLVVIWVTIYSELIDPGRDDAFYQAYAMRIAPVIGIASGIPLLFTGGLLAARRRGELSGWLAGAAVGIAYAIIDLPLIAALAGSAGGPIPWGYVALSYSTKIVAAAAGGWQSGKRISMDG